MWRVGSRFGLSGSALDHARLITFLIFAGVFFALGAMGKLPRSARYRLAQSAELTVDEPELASE
jgi:hypothetical protein